MWQKIKCFFGFHKVQTWDEIEIWGWPGTWGGMFNSTRTWEVCHECGYDEHAIDEFNRSQYDNDYYP